MKNLYLVFFACILLLCGCNGVGEKDTLLARINDEKVYTEDEQILVKMKGKSPMDRSHLLYSQIFSKVALTSRGLSEFPELAAEWEQYYKDIDVRILTMVFQRFHVMERLTYSEEELRMFYEGNKQLFSADSDNTYDRSKVAGEYYVYKNPDAWKDFLSRMTDSTAKLTAQDTASLKEHFVTEYRNSLRVTAIEKARNNPRITINPVPSVSAEAYYEKNKERFMTVPGYEVYHIQGKDSASLMKAVPAEASLEQFKAAAFKRSTNKETAKDSGYVGVVKRDFALPYGIGKMPEMDEALKDKAAGFVTAPIQSSVTKDFHRFYLVRQVPSEIKPFDRAKADAQAMAETDGMPEMDSSFALVMLDSTPVFTVADYGRYCDKYFHAPKNKRSLDYIINAFVESFAFAVAAKEAKLDHSWEYRALVRDTRVQFISEEFIDRKLAVHVSDDSLMNFYNRMDSTFRERYTFEKAKPELLKYLTLPVNLYKHDYYMGYRVLYTGLTYEQSIPKIYARRAEEYRSWMQMRWTDEAYASAVKHIYDVSVKEHEQEYDPSLLMAKADSLAKAGNRSLAYQFYRKVMNAYATDDSLYQAAAYESAQVQNDNEEYKDAEGEFYAFYTMWPNNRNAEKAMFTRGFILDENVHNDTLALQVLEGFQKLYPNSELKESVDWLVNNIKSGGKLADDLMKKIETEE